MALLDWPPCASRRLYLSWVWRRTSKSEMQAVMKACNKSVRKYYYSVLSCQFEKCHAVHRVVTRPTSPSRPKLLKEIILAASPPPLLNWAPVFTTILFSCTATDCKFWYYWSTGHTAPPLISIDRSMAKLDYRVINGIIYLTTKKKKNTPYISSALRRSPFKSCLFIDSLGALCVHSSYVSKAICGLLAWKREVNFECGFVQSLLHSLPVSLSLSISLSA